jgi:hypothetical protein
MEGHRRAPGPSHVWIGGIRIAATENTIGILVTVVVAIAVLVKAIAPYLGDERTHHSIEVVAISVRPHAVPIQIVGARVTVMAILVDAVALYLLCAWMHERVLVVGVGVGENAVAVEITIVDVPGWCDGHRLAVHLRLAGALVAGRNRCDAPG